MTLEEKRLLKAMKNVIANAGGYHDLQGAWIENGKQYVCDAVRIIENPNPFKELPETMGMEKMEKWFPYMETLDKSYPIPDRKTIEVGIKETKAKAKKKGIKKYTVIYTLEENSTAVNAEYLLDAVLATGAEYAFKQSGNIRSPLYFFEEDALWKEGMVRVMTLPVMPKEEEKEGRFSYVEY